MTSPPPSAPAAPPFDDLAASYDRDFTASAVGRAQRAAVWRRLALSFAAGERVLELGCGTGEDALYLARRGVRVLATDASPAMVAAARRKVAAAGLEGLIDLRVMAIEDLAPPSGGPFGGPCGGPFEGPFDGALSSFGALNCIAELAPVARRLGRWVKPGGRAVLCLMGPLVPWEWLWFLLRGRPRTALRRLRPGGVLWRGVRVRYPGIRTVRRAFAPWWRARRVAAVGALVPPSYAEGWASRHPRLLAFLGRWERRLEAFPPLPWLADHYLLELERR